MPYRLIKTMDGRRGGLLFIAGLSYILIGVANIVTKPSISLDLAFSWISHPTITATTLGWMWVVAGVVMLIGGAISAGHSTLESAGYVTSLIPPFVWAFIFCGSYLFGNPYGLRSGFVYLFVAILMYYIAGWPNTVTLKKESTDVTSA